MKFLKHISVYTFVGFFGAGVNFFILPVLSHYLEPADYGLLSLFTSYVSILLPLIGFMAYSFLNIEYFKTRDKKEFASKFVSVQFVPVLPFMVMSAFAWIFFYRVNHLLELENMSRLWGLLLIFLAFATIYIETLFNFLIFQKKVGLYSVATIVKVIVEMGLALFFIVNLKMGWQGRIYAWGIVTLIFLVIGLMYFKKQGFLEGKIQWPLMKEGILFGLPLILHTIGKFVINQSDRLFITKMISLDAAGIYNIGYTIGTVVLILITAFFNFYGPFLLERLSDLNETKKLQIVKMSYYFVIGMVVLMIGIRVMTPLVFRYFIDHRYIEGTNYVFWVGLSYCFWGGYLLFTTYISYYKQNRILGWLAVINVVLNCLFNYWLIKMYGAMGAAYATALSFFIVFVLVAYEANKLIKLPWFRFREITRVKL
jgi:O-antigen/teichoic acid export membrane protein